METFSAKLSNLRIAPRKVRLVADLIRGASATNAQHQLKFSTKKASGPLLKLLNSAMTNAKNLKESTKDEGLYIKDIFVNEGPKLKRHRPRARGVAYQIQKKTSHITLILGEQEKKQDIKKSKSEVNLRRPEIKLEENKKGKTEAVVEK
ncbi:MAG: 50S ribosomal protein L22 [Candidatus Spechtbacteria bacterium RIFCSPLOWO2_12_FULL_38_22]|uniref:Large ribosomal subunit protein uL22 n=1 Tax=Candidatus Spechtbacteria bacterium RIFCSPLOWO2_12_FULL_38_22 TaxID=1802165 RepID=A0A1G2HJU5_9BACT|nr:MAG: 50S ribosomal protein L22 [Candidatus Spechtbacteria bacterium RIFCSPHIGHO2_01_FULL_38_11]OGZ59295.1 MAG: 50S ribosomal protein L22 [Candidatus Spechtbacteria bacterium RIFCSPHIGHO2_12_FULL_38_30]OGZ60764.1 MAG: 50S ribosomal protein L22 [Candidatus Spechtbacteria bacterium RIFCSPLOWO2_01_FULL_38_20]OGZ62168.1 MAG: 50S ribosomal protein L22 [Candidatus Spechtbacteria bacterium RIFCSPLOWO2_12_FULL_38_22]